MLDCVTGSGMYELSDMPPSEGSVEEECRGGGSRPPRVTEEMKPADWRARERRRMEFVDGTEVRPRRALDAFWRCEQTFARWTRDMLYRVLRGVSCNG